MPSLPRVLGIGEQASWVVPPAEVFAAYRGIETIGAITEMRANVRLTGGDTCRSDAHAPDLEGWERALGVSGEDGRR